MIKQTNLNTLLSAPDGYEISEALLMTYSLSFAVLDSIMIDIGLTTRLRNELEKLSEHTICFMDKRKFHESNDDNSISRLLNKKGSIVPINENASFHPKLIALLYKSRENEKQRLRLIISSRNLTSSNYFEGAVVIEGDVLQQTYKENEALADYIDYINKNAKSSTAKIFSDKIKHTDFSESIKNLLGGCQSAEYSFICVTPEAGRLLLPCNAQEIRIISPFLGSSDFIGKTVSGAKWKIITRHFVNNTSAGNMIDEERNKHFFCLADEMPPLHAKMYAVNTDEASYIYIGSSNFSDNGFNNNFELMLCIKANTADFDFVKLIDNSLFDLYPCEFTDEGEDEISYSPLPEESADTEELIKKLKAHLSRKEAAEFFTTILGHNVSNEYFAEEFVDDAVNGKVSGDDIIKRTKKYAQKPHPKSVQKYIDEILGDNEYANCKRVSRGNH